MAKLSDRDDAAPREGEQEITPAQRRFTHAHARLLHFIRTVGVRGEVVPADEIARRRLHRGAGQRLAHPPHHPH